jgi:predicted Fe-Mo cluster-binding NifX family protein
MRIAVSATEPEREAPLDRRFGRCAHFVFADTESEEWEAFANPAREAGGGAGPQAAEFVASKGAECVISGNFGPNAYGALAAAGVAVYKSSGGSVSKAIQAYIDGQLEKVTAPTAGRGGGGRRGRAG